MHKLKESRFESLKDIEAVISKAAKNEAVKLSSSTISKRHGALRDAARLQALASIARQNKDKDLALQDSSNKQDILDELCSYAPGLTAIRLNKTVTINQEKINRRLALLPAREKMLASDLQMYEKIIRGRTIDLSCISGAERQYLSPLFSSRSSHSVKNSSDMKQTMVSIFKQINKSEFSNLDGELLNSFGIFCCELFKNTQEHALKDEFETPYIEHVEGIIVSWSDLTSEMFEDDFSGHKRLKEYWDRNASSEFSNRNTLRCMQVSFFDTGPGLVGRAFGSNLDELSEREALLNCIAKNFTTKRESGAGNGYPAILNQLSKVGGLLRIRSGRHCLFNCFDKSKHGFWNGVETIESRREKQTAYLMNFDNWTNDTLSKAHGTVVSIIVPLRIESGQHNLF
ncbi:hypothetical protein [Pseudoalteromonas lipolytica]|uniref:hypothetical protein n=1 Tax=Pseudoalteromonas lipolytica TaxID=570156 RepID=UPI000C60BCF7|nr:hypothetical protein [Pseudoalteromonas lipolytica]MAE01417.1 hypothetical protein [Pseudoalteromonas sp.]|tara:strand:+ start:12017 stop:13216 length:1200 start_codon:yes stop_codon:yes gene_type:complete